MTEREKFIVLVNDQSLEKADAIILLEGDGFFRLPHAVKLYQEGWAEKIVVSGGIKNQLGGSFPADEIIVKLKEMGVTLSGVLAESASQNTAEQARNIIAMAEENHWQKIILVASAYHQYRAFLAFLRARKGAGLKIQLINSPVRGLPWFKKNKWGRRIDLLDLEFKKIKRYKNDVVSFAEGVAYLKRKEQQN